jgi:signal transduction histidine kinase
MPTNTEQPILQQKADELNNKAWRLRVSDSTLSYNLSKEAIAVSESIDYIKGRAEGYRTLGFCNIRLSKYDEAMPLLQQADLLFASMNNACGQSDILEYYGIITRGKGDYAASLDHLYKSLELREKENYEEGVSHSLYHLGVTYRYMGNLEQALDLFLKDLSYSKKIGNWVGESYTLNNIGSIYFELGDYPNALEYFQRSLAMRKESGDKWGEAGCLDNIGLIYFQMCDYEKALEYCSEGLSISQKVEDKKGQGNCLFHLGKIYEQLQDYDKTVNYCQKSLEIRRQTSDKKGEAEILLFLAELSLLENYYEKYSLNPYDLLNIALKSGEEIKSLDLLSKVHIGFYKISKHFKHYQQALEHLEKNMALQKEIHSAVVQQKILSMEIDHQLENSKKETEIYRLRNIELAGLYEETTRQKEEIEAQKRKVEAAFIELKATQAQLIQREKMASLGELTAGIAHEIQNPLNFVNNFSEVNKELIEELKSQKSKLESDELDELLNDIADNEEKINHHGKRADAIVKGMLQHSGASSGQKEPADINALADEYLRLSYHGFRAKDKSFNAGIRTDFNESIGKVNVVPQDIGRVLLNLYNNSFYAMNEKIKQHPHDYQPSISVTTEKLNNSIKITVKDNGSGIPQNVVDKIFQPFFTTKPTGQGTGLGLSLSYDIIKAHGGEIKIETMESQGSEFIIHLPS